MSAWCVPPAVRDRPRGGGGAPARPRAECAARALPSAYARCRACRGQSVLTVSSSRSATGVDTPAGTGRSARSRDSGEARPRCNNPPTSLVRTLDRLALKVTPPIARVLDLHPAALPWPVGSFPPLRHDTLEASLAQGRVQLPTISERVRGHPGRAVQSQPLEQPPTFVKRLLHHALTTDTEHVDDHERERNGTVTVQHPPADVRKVGPAFPVPGNEPAVQHEPFG
jgi:hypothetical protein